MRISDWSSDVCSSDLFDFGAAKLDVGVFVSVKTLHHPIYQLIDQKSVDRGGYFRFDYAGGPVEATLGGELRVGDVHSRRFVNRSEEHTSELQSLMRISYAVFCLIKNRPHHLYLHTFSRRISMPILFRRADIPFT